jgi:hypothetical protein
MVSCSANCEFDVNVLVRTLVRFCPYSFADQAPFPTPTDASYVVYAGFSNLR